MEDIREAKSLLRRQILDQRAELTGEDIANKSACIMERLEGLESFRKARAVLCYVDFGREVRTSACIRRWLAGGKEVLVPSIVPSGDGRRELRASLLLDFEEDLEGATLGILEPKPHKRRFTDPGVIDFVVVPGLAFDLSGNRLGYGAGFYDRFLRLVRGDCAVVAVSFDFQVFDRIPAGVEDFPVDRIVTESRIIG